MHRNLRQDLANLSNLSVADMNYNKLATHFGNAVVEREEMDRKNANDYYNGNEGVQEAHIDLLKRAIAEKVAEENAEINGNLPVASVFDAYQIASAAKDEFKRDVGIHALVGHLQTKWKRDKVANLTASEFYNLKEHYKFNYPRSAAKDIIEEIGKRGYSTLDMGKLIDIANQVQSQEDYEYHIKANGLASNSHLNKKARQFILALVNGEERREEY